MTNNRNGSAYDTFDLRSTYNRVSSKRVSKDAWISSPHMHKSLIPGKIEDEHDEKDILGNDIIKEDRPHKTGNRRSFSRRLFLFLTEPSSSFLSAVFFFFLMVAITIANLITIMQSMASFQYRPAECDFCAADGDYYAASEDRPESAVDCVCPLQSLPYLDRVLGIILNFLALEWTLRVLSYVPANPRSDVMGQWGAWLRYLTSTTTLMDALATWPYFMEYDLPGLISLRLLRLFRVFRIFRLGSYNSMFVSLTKVISRSIAFLKLMVVIMFFGATIFGSLVFWLEQGKWKYWEATGDFQYIRMGVDGKTEEISPFSSIPSSFWWFVVTATTVGYGDYYPTSTAGQWVSALAMFTGLLVIALPVSVFSDLWSEELKEVKGLESLFEDDSCDDIQNVSSSENPKQNYGERIGPHEAQLLKNEYQTLDVAEEDVRSHISKQVVLEREDMKEIVSSIRDIHEKQRNIQRILKKYLIYDEDEH